MTRLPQLIVAGAMKAGTTSVMGYLGSLPAFNVGRIKEPNIFTVGSSSSQVKQKSTINYFGRHGLRVDGTTEYSKPDDTLAHARTVHRFVPNAQVVFLVRDPVARARSHFVHNRARGIERQSQMLLALDEGSDYVRTSHYRECIAPWADLFGDRLAILNSDLLFRADHAETNKFRRVFDLEAETSIRFDRLNAGGAIANVQAARRISRSIPGYAFVRPLIPAVFRSAAVSAVGFQERRRAEEPDIDETGVDAHLQRLLEAEIAWVSAGCPVSGLAQ